MIYTSLLIFYHVSKIHHLSVYFFLILHFNNCCHLFLILFEYLIFIYRHNSINQFESLCTKFSYQSISKFQRILSLSLSTTKREESTYRSHARILSLVKHLDYAFHPFRTYLHPPLPVPPGTLVKRLETIPFTRIVINPWRGYRLFSLPRLPWNIHIRRGFIILDIDF